MEFRKNKIQIWIGLLLMLIGIVLYQWIIPWQIINVGHYGMSPYILPRVYSLILIFMAILLIGNSLLIRKTGVEDEKDQKKAYEFNRDEMIWVIILYVVMLGYVFIIESLGYIISSIICLLIFFLIFNEKRWWLIIPVSIVLPVTIYYFFRLSLKMFLPEGIFIQ